MALKMLPARLGGLPDRVGRAPKVADRELQSGAWASLVADIKRERGAYCQRCGAGGKLYADHIQERRDGGALLDKGNIQLLCASCHGLKTASARRERAAGQL